MALNPMYSLLPDDPDLFLFADKILDNIHTRSVPVLKAELQKRDLMLTEKLLQGLSRSVARNYQEKVVEFVIEMDSHGQFQDYRTTRYSGRPNFNQGGIGFFDYALKGYKKSGFKNVRPFSNLPAFALKTPEASVRYMAFGAVVNMGKKATVTRPSARSGWFKEYFAQIIGPMNDSLQQAAEAVALKEAENAIAKTFSNHIIKIS